MIVDDNATWREYLVSLIAGRAETLTCADGAEAVAAYVTYRPHTVLLDIEMPGTDGFTAARQMIAQDPEARIVIVTQHSQRRYQEAAARLGAVGLVGKEDLTRIEELLNHWTTRADGREAFKKSRQSTSSQ